VWLINQYLSCIHISNLVTVERPTRTPISIDLANLQSNPIASPNSPGGVPQPYDVKTPAMLRLVQRQILEIPQGNRY